jgi:hypothetical protein
LILTCIIFGEECRSWSSSRCYLVHLKPKYHPQQPIPEHSQPMFLPQCDRQNLTTTHNR